LVDGWRRWLRAQGLDAGQAEAGADEALTALQTTLASDTGRWLLADHPGGAAEQAWTSRDGELTVKHVIDRVFIADGVRWIVDYKTVRATPEELPARAEGFRPQLDRYAALFANDPLPLKLAVWFVLQGRLVELLPAS
jgi:ATP-dependent exoDNAse (exonuclease V) beta subunit